MPGGIRAIPEPSLDSLRGGESPLGMFHVKHRGEKGQLGDNSSAGRDRALQMLGADLEFARRLDTYVELLGRWRRITNLISEATFPDVWVRHIADSGQLLAYAPEARRWVDMGSGAGFPGLVIAMQLAGTPGAEIHCIEADQRKCAFLREVARQTGAPARIHAMRLETIAPETFGPVDAVCARALAPLPRLVEFAKEWIGAGAVGLFPRGKSADEQIEALPEARSYRTETFASKIDPNSQIVRIRGAE